ncbi:hypothetical protein PFISCL1PPCAC_6663, partial [Pristionchus fissidentatus]
LRKNIEEYIHRIDKLRKEGSRRTSKYFECIRCNEESGKDNEDDESKRALEEELEASQTRNVSLLEEIRQVRVKILQEKEEKTVMIAGMSNLHTTIDELRARNEELEYGRSIVGIERNIEVESETIKELEKLAKNSEEARETAVLQAIELRANSQKLSKKCSEVEEELTEEKHRIDRLEEELKSSSEKLENVNREKIETMTELTVVRHKLNVMKKEKETVVPVEDAKIGGDENSAEELVEARRTIDELTNNQFSLLETMRMMETKYDESSQRMDELLDANNG